MGESFTLVVMANSSEAEICSHHVASALRLDLGSILASRFDPGVGQSRCCWKKSDHSWRFARAAKAAGENPAVVTIYVGRGHSSIARELRASIPVRVVAVNHDTRVVTIERTYSRYIGDHADVLARKALLDLAATPSSYVVPIAAGR